MNPQYDNDQPLSGHTAVLPSSSVQESSMMGPQALTVSIPPKNKSYTIYIETGALVNIGDFFLKAFDPARQRFLMVIDKNVAPLYRAKVQLSLEQAGFQIFELVLPAGETIKCQEMVERIYDTALDIGLTRQDGLIALGGGVIGDLTGYCAATFYRGVNFVQLPTTLLAQVDSSVGGKVGINYKTVKNGIGAFYQPNLVVVDPKTLSTLPERELRAGLAEVVKYALIEKSCTGKDLLFSYLRSHSKNLLPVYGEIIRACCSIKATVVEKDETESKGLREFLNLGHTFGHAFEAAIGYGELVHGEAVAIGIIKAFQLAIRLGEVSKKQMEPVLALYEQLELPTRLPRELDSAYLLHLMRQDKKARHGQIRLILPVEKLGQVAAFDRVSDADILAIL